MWASELIILWRDRSVRRSCIQRDCVDEIMARLPDCASNQWGVWVVQVSAYIH